MNIYIKNIFPLLLTITSVTSAQAQQQQPAQRTSALQRIAIKDSSSKMKSTAAVVDPAKEITRKISDTMDMYLSYPNDKNTWAVIINKVNTILYEYYRSGYLKGRSSKEAFFVSMGQETMTAADIQNNKMIMIAGIATKKPAEFEILRFEKIGTSVKDSH